MAPKVNRATLAQPAHRVLPARLDPRVNKGILAQPALLAPKARRGQRVTLAPKAQLVWLVGILTAMANLTKPKI